MSTEQGDAETDLDTIFDSAGIDSRVCSDGTVSVTISGTRGTVDISVEPGATVESLVADALEALRKARSGAKLLYFVLDGQDADGDAAVVAGQVLTAGPKSANG